jgi:hypothetical protein
MTDKYPPTMQRPALLKLVEALGCRPQALRRDEYGDWHIVGKQGWIHAVPEGFQLVYFARSGVNEWDGAGPHMEDYVRAKRSLTFCRLSQDGTGEGIFFLGRLPTADEAEIIREIFVIFKKREVGEPSEAQIAARAAFTAAQRARKHDQGDAATGKSGVAGTEDAK